MSVTTCTYILGGEFTTHSGHFKLLFHNFLLFSLISSHRPCFSLVYLHDYNRLELQIFTKYLFHMWLTFCDFL